MAPKTKKQYIRVSIVGYIPAANILNQDSIQKQFKRLNTIENFANEQMEDVEYKAKQVGRLVSTDSVAEPKNKTDDALLETKTPQEPLDPLASSTDNTDDENKKSATEENP